MSQGALGAKTVAMSAQHAGGILEYNAHSLFGLMESRATRTALERITDQRPFLLTRSTFASSGKYSAHWTGDNSATWRDLQASIITMNSLSLFGISVTGADICGFVGDSTEELCARWIEVGAFSPFSRDHTETGSASQELYVWPAVAAASKTALGMRYSLLPHLYTLLYQAHTIGSTVMNALWVHFPSDPQAFNREQQYMWSDSLLFSPVVTQGATSVDAYFPKGTWYSLFDLDDAVRGATVSSAAGTTVTIPTPLEKTNVHVRGGSIVPTQEPAMTTAAARKTPFTLLVAVDPSVTVTSSSGPTVAASGKLFLDDGVQLNLDVYRLMSYTATVVSDGIVVVTAEVEESKGSWEEGAVAAVGRIDVRGLQQLRKNVMGVDSVGSCVVSLAHPSVATVMTLVGAYSATADRLMVDLTSAKVTAGESFSVTLVCSAM